jgi:hypothetical protein
MDAALWQSRGHLNQEQVWQLLGHLLPELKILHAQGRIHGHIAPEQILVSGEDVSLAPASSSGRSDSEQLYGSLEDGYAAFEQYVDAADGPLGPWTDIYGLSALAYALITGQAPPHAVRRMIVDACGSLDIQAYPGYHAGFLAAIDRGLSLAPSSRQQTLDEFVLSLGIQGSLDATLDMAGRSAGPAQPDPPAVAANALPQHPQPPALADMAAPRRMSVWPVAAAVIVLLGIGLFWLGRGSSSMDAVETAQTDSRDADVATGAEAARIDAPNPGLIASADLEVLPGPEMTSAPVSGSEASARRDPETELPPEQALDDETALTAVSGQADAWDNDARHAEAEHEELGHAGIEEGGNAQAEDKLSEADTPKANLSEAEPPKAEKAVSQERRRDETPAGRMQQVRLAVQPWGEIYINGKSKGVSPPLKTISLAPGTYQVKIVNGSLPVWSGSLTVQPGEPATIAHDFGA